MMADRGVALTHTTILRWVQRYLSEFERRWSRYARPVGGSWRMDETYIKVGGRWVYLYRAVDKAGRTVDFFLSRNRGCECCKDVSPQCEEEQGETDEDHAGRLCGIASRSTENEGGGRTSPKSDGPIEPIFEQSHRTGPRRVKQRIRPMLGFNDSTTRRSPLAESNWRIRSRRASSRPASSEIGKRQCRNWGARRSPLDPIVDPNMVRAHSTSSVTRVCT